jgi:hypothetical protein
MRWLDKVNFFLILYNSRNVNGVSSSRGVIIEDMVTSRGIFRFENLRIPEIFTEAFRFKILNWLSETQYQSA